MYPDELESVSSEGVVPEASRFIEVVISETFQIKGRGAAASLADDPRPWWAIGTHKVRLTTPDGATMIADACVELARLQGGHEVMVLLFPHKSREELPVGTRIASLSFEAWVPTSRRLEKASATMLPAKQPTPIWLRLFAASCGATIAWCIAVIIWNEQRMPWLFLWVPCFAIWGYFWREFAIRLGFRPNPESDEW